jgi:hypothetical protein
MTLTRDESSNVLADVRRCGRGCSAVMFEQGNDRAFSPSAGGYLFDGLPAVLPPSIPHTLFLGGYVGGSEHGASSRRPAGVQELAPFPPPASSAIWHQVTWAQGVTLALPRVPG